MPPICRETSSFSYLSLNPLTLMVVWSITDRLLPLVLMSESCSFHRRRPPFWHSLLLVGFLLFRSWNHYLPKPTPVTPLLQSSSVRWRSTHSLNLSAISHRFVIIITLLQAIGLCHRLPLCAPPIAAIHQ